MSEQAVWWRVCRGWGDSDSPDFDLHWQVRFDNWQDAHLRMLAIWLRWLNDDCETCAQRALDQLPNLMNLPPDQGWSGEVEGDDYYLQPDRAHYRRRNQWPTETS